MAFLWRFVSAAGVAVDGPAISFTTTEAAEQWLSEEAADLRAAGIDAASLFDEERALSEPGDRR
ncbi:hypothetical protein [Nakamurella leprariae]|uniref:Uncharacterized protein n=1 Tax=Nakamurella leprariae TaxID=2803911 RepID=A0A938YCF9_9ACTN|nr:hypothetical protein [Nakamurella leprariae]MBM9468077.1 hypothetical protein [Nakamurella leprariae]